MVTRIATTALSVLAVGVVGAQPSPYVISRHQVGPVALGAPAQIVYERVADRELIDLELEGHLSPALALTLPGLTQRGGVIAELVPRDNYLAVWRISISDPSVRTEKGIGVGSTVDDVRGAYAITSVGYGEGAFIVRVEELSASFVLESGDPGWRDQSSVPGHLKVISILLTR